MVAWCLQELQSNIKASRKPDEQALNVPRGRRNLTAKILDFWFSPGSERDLDRDGLSQDFEVPADKNDVSPDTNGVVGTSAA